MENNLEYLENSNPLRAIIFGDGKALPTPKICRWNMVESKDGIIETPPNEECQPNVLDVALQVNEPSSFDPAPFIEIFSGNIERIHICQKCHPNIIINNIPDKPKTHVHGIFGLALVHASLFNGNTQRQKIDITRDYENLVNNLGEQILYINGFRKPIALDDLGLLMAFIINISFLVIVTVWLGLRAHRKVLDYFAHSGALMPLVAASGKRSFYGAIWLITLSRVLFFLMAALPVSLSVTADLFTDKQLSEYLNPLTSELLLWLLTISSSFTLTMAIGSIADLKQRHLTLGFVYRYAPLLICLSGALLWGFSFLSNSENIILLRTTMAALPIIGITPVLLAPAFQPALEILAIHSVIAIVTIVFVFRRNARWFAAHLEEL